MTCQHGASLKFVIDQASSRLKNGEETASLFDANGVLGEIDRIAVDDGGEFVQIFATSQSVPKDQLPDGTVLTRYSRIADRADPNVQPTDKQIEALSDEMANLDDIRHDAANIPAIYTYFGQFLAHDLTHLHFVSNGGIYTNENSSALDLDGLRRAQRPPGSPDPTVYWEHDVGIGVTAGINQYASSHDDLPRDDEGYTLIPDRRNDSNLALAQIHIALSKYFHLLTRGEAKQDPDRAAHLATLHLQEITLFDYLERLVDPVVYGEVLKYGRGLIHPDGLAKGTDFFVPIEFAAACFRYGHSMVRSKYQWNDAHRAFPDRLLENTKRGGALAVGKYLMADWVVDWSTMAPLQRRPGAFDSASNISIKLPAAFKKLDSDLFENQRPGRNINLAEMTLMRGKTLAIPPAQHVFQELRRDLGSSHTVARFLTADEIADCGYPTLKRVLLRGAAGARLAERTPLWFYTLRESEFVHGGQRLGPLASRIVMETLHAAIEASGSGLIKDNRLATIQQDGSVARYFHGTLIDLLRLSDTWKPIH